jgi:rod shape-determining protein MreC
VITSPPKQGSRTQRTERPRVLLFVAALMLGSAVSAVERLRPGLIEPGRQRLSSTLSGYFRPLLEATQGGRRLTNRVGQLWGVESDFRRVERELMQTRLELQLAQEQLRRMGRISGLRQWRGPEELEFVLADVIGFSTGGASAEWIINRGAADGMEVGLPVVGQKGLAGVIREVSDRTSRVQALSDPQSAVGVAERDARNRGIVFGVGRDLPMEFIPENENAPIVPGTQLITSGFGKSVYPKGIVVGTIKARRRNFRGVDFGVVEPSETFNALEEVLVITRAAVAQPAGPLEGLGAYSFATEPEASIPMDPEAHETPAGGAIPDAEPELPVAEETAP